MECVKGTKVYCEQKNIYGVLTGRSAKIGTVELVEISYDSKVTYVPATQLHVEEADMDPTSLYQQRRFFGFQYFRQYLTHLRIKGGLTNVVYSMKYGDVKFLPYQFKPVFKFIEANEQRLLIADEVGLGKTIESLYIWKELQAREDAQRLLIVCPAMLRGKWKKDMEIHFGINAQIVDAGTLLSECKEARIHRNKQFALVTSLEGIRQKNLEEPCRNKNAQDLNIFFEKIAEDPDNNLFDLVVFDEAAKLVNPGSANFVTCRRVNLISRNLLLLSATPVSNSVSDLYSLLRILSPSEYKSEEQFLHLYEQNRPVVRLSHYFYNPVHDLKAVMSDANDCIEEIKHTDAFGKDPFFHRVQDNLEALLTSNDLRKKTYDQITERFFYSSVFSRSRKRDVIKDVAIRSPQTVHFELSDLELGIYEECSRDLREKSKEDHGYIVAFGIMSRQRELASSLPAALRRWKNLLASNRQKMNEEDEYEEEIEYDYSSIPETCLSLSEEDLHQIELKDTKYLAFLKALKYEISKAQKEGRVEKIVVFSFFRETLNYLYAKLRKDGVNALVIMGGMSQQDKDDNLNSFRSDPAANVLLSSEVGAEGLDMQFSSIEFNYDLPWNPMRLEQRIGRIDRIGQESKKLRIVNLFCTNTIEDRVLERLYEKINIFKESIGELDEILGEQTQNIEKALLNPTLSEKNKEDLADAEINRFYTSIQSIKTLEESAGLSKAYSDSIIDYVNMVEHNSRYIRKEDIVNYLVDYFTKDGNGTRFDKDSKNPDVWNLELSQEDRLSLSDFLQRTGLYFNGANLQKMKCTFPQGKKIVSNVYVNIDVNHPILKWVFEKVDSRTGNASNCFTLKLPRSAVDSKEFERGVYTFLICDIKCEGLKKRKELVYLVCSPEDLQVKPMLASENFIAQALFNGMEETNLSTKLMGVSDSLLDRALELCKKAFYEKAAEIKNDVEEGNEAVYYRMVAKAKSFYEDKISSIQEVIDRQRDEIRDCLRRIRDEITSDFSMDDLPNTLRALKAKKNRTEFEEKKLTYLTSLQNSRNAIQMNEGRLKNEKIRFDDAINGIEEKKSIDFSFDELAMGVVFLI